jgi:hypothetical protein
MASTLLRNNKTVHFDTALNWEDEDQRTAQGVEVWRITYSILQQTGTIERIEDIVGMMFFAIISLGF